MSSSLNPYVALIAQKQAALNAVLADIARLEGTLAGVKSFAYLTWTANIQAQLHALIPNVVAPPSGAGAGADAMLNARQWASNIAPQQIRALRTLSEALQREVVDLAAQRDELDRAAVEAIAGGASEQDAYNGARARMQFRQTAWTVAKYAAVIVGALGLIWLGVIMYRRIKKRAG